MQPKEKSDRKESLRKKHSIEGSETCKLKCETSEKKMVRQKLKCPRKTMELKHKCSFCSYSSVDARNLRRHLHTHTGERPHECSDCKKTFSLKHHLRDHMRIHTGEKPFKCGKCSQAFSRKTHLQRHEIIHSGNAPYVCSTCGQNFRRKPSLKVHERTHIPCTTGKKTEINLETKEKHTDSLSFAEPYNNIQC